MAGLVACVLSACSSYDPKLLSAAATAGTSGSIGSSGKGGADGGGTGGTGAMSGAGGTMCLADGCEPEDDAGIDTCPKTAADCDDARPCTRDLLDDSAGPCAFECANEPITEAADDGCCAVGQDLSTDPDCDGSCGNGVIEPGEDCDGGTTCVDCKLPAEQSACVASHATEAMGSVECRRCACINCTAETQSCLDDTDTTRQMLCDDLVICALAQNCVGQECYCGDLDNDPLCLYAEGPCIPEVEAAAGTQDSTDIAERSMDDNYAVARGRTLSECVAMKCADVCPH